jgi:tetratricopeptide (TPR) repeat protein
MLAPEKDVAIMLVANDETARSFDLAAALLDIIMDIEPLPGRRLMGFKFAEIMETEGIDAARAFVAKTKEDTVERKNYLWKENEGAFINPGYHYLEVKKYPEAIELFRFNVEQFPTSGWAYAHLAYACAESGDHGMARQYYEKAIELVPDEPSFKAELSKLGK